MDTPTWLTEILKKNEFENYHAFYKVVRHNHKPQGLIALARLCDNQKRVEEYSVAMEPSVPKYTGESDHPPEVDYIQSTKMEDYRGKHVGFYKLFEMVKDLYNNKYEKDVHKLIKDICPGVIDGHIHGAFHGLIQIAYGLASGSDVMVLEGITWLYQQYSPMFIDDLDNPKRTDLKPFGQGKSDILDVMKKLQDEYLVKEIREENKRDAPLRKEMHYFGIYCWAGPKYHSDMFMDLVNDVKLPDWFHPEEKNMEQLKKLLGWILDMMAVTYVKSDVVNDFFLLHGITGSWSAEKVLPLLDFDSALLGVRGLLGQLLMTYVEQNSNPLTKNPEDFFQGEVNQASWDKLINESVKGEFYEYHVYKAIQCLYERWKENQDSEYSKYYFAGACAAKDNRFHNFPNKLADHL